MTFRSTFSQIVWLQVLTIAATSLMMPLAIFLFLDRTVSDYQVRMLGLHERALFAALSGRPAPAGMGLPEPVTAPYRLGVDGFAFSIVDAQGRALLGSKADRPVLAAPPARRAVTVFRSRIGGRRYFGASFPETYGGRPIWIQVGQNMEDPDVVMDDVLARFIPEVGGLTAVLMLLLLGVDIVIVRRALRPILQASQMAGDISPRRIDVRLPYPHMPREIQPLITAVNQALDRLEQGFRAQRDLTADVAHELRTPLAVLRLRAEAIDDPRVRRPLLSDIDVMTRTVSQLLAMAELQNMRVDPADRADLRQVGLDVVEHLAPMAVQAGRQMALVAGPAPVWVRGQGDMLFQAVRNLVENAIAHAPAGTEVTVEIAADGRLRVLDRGPGVAPQDRARIFDRFWSRRRERSSVGAGAGLGLSIVAKIADNHAGAVTAEDRPGGGSVFTLSLPQADPAPPGGGGGKPLIREL